jgi:hypothetical protein
MKRLLQVILAAVLLLASVGYAAWKTDREWQAAYECHCGNVDALFSTRDGYLQTHLLGAALAIVPIVAGIFFLVVYRPIGYVIIGFLIGVRLLTQWDVRDAYAQLMRDTALFEMAIMFVPVMVAAGLDIKKQLI